MKRKLSHDDSSSSAKKQSLSSSSSLLLSSVSSSSSASSLSASSSSLLPSSSTNIKSYVIYSLLINTNLPLDVNKIIESYLSIQHIYSYQDREYYKMNVIEKKWTKLTCSGDKWKSYDNDSIMTLCQDGSLLLTPNLENGTSKGKIITKYTDNTWNVVTVMEEDRAAFSVVEHENQFWIIGGNTDIDTSPVIGSTYKATPTIFHWNNGWNSGAEMKFSRSSASTVLFNNKIYVFGGCMIYLIQETCECYDIHENKWNRLKSMPSGRWNHQAVVYDEVRPSILVMGGFDTGFLFRTTIFLYDIVSNSWSTLKWKLPFITTCASFSAHMCHQLTQLIVTVPGKPIQCWIRDVTNDSNDWIVLPNL